MIEELDVILKLMLVVAAAAAVFVTVYAVVKAGRDSEEVVRREYEERLKQKDELIGLLKEKLGLCEERAKEEARRLATVSRMMRETWDAIEAGAVRLACPEHPEASVSVLQDGTIVCSEGHRLWPRVEVGEE